MAFEPKSPEVKLVAELLKLPDIAGEKDIKLKSSIIVLKGMLPTIDADPEIRNMVAKIFDHIKLSWKKEGV